MERVPWRGHCVVRSSRYEHRSRQRAVGRLNADKICDGDLRGGSYSRVFSTAIRSKSSSRRRTTSPDRIAATTMTPHANPCVEG